MRGGFDAAFQVVFVFEGAEFGGDEAEHDGFAFGQEAQRFEVAAAGIAVFHEVGVKVYLLEQRFADRLVVAALRKKATTALRTKLIALRREGATSRTGGNF